MRQGKTVRQRKNGRRTKAQGGATLQVSGVRFLSSGRYESRETTNDINSHRCVQESNTRANTRREAIGEDRNMKPVTRN